jgi:TPR repeat protein
LQRFMKTSFIIIFALLLVGCASKRPSASPAQQSDASTRFAEIKIKAEKGDAKAQFNLGICYYRGEGVTKDAAEAVKWYREAAEQGYAQAQNGLGFCYGNGLGVRGYYGEAPVRVRWSYGDERAVGDGYSTQSTGDSEQPTHAPQVVQLQKLKHITWATRRGSAGVPPGPTASAQAGRRRGGCRWKQRK